MDSLGTQLMVVLTISRVPRLLSGWAHWLGLSHDHWPADILVFDWGHEKPAALDIAVASPLNANILLEAGDRVIGGAAAQAAEARNPAANNQNCSDLGWACVPIAVESCGKEAQECFSCLASCPTRPLSIFTVD